MNKINKIKLIQICRKHISRIDDVVLCEPYIPYIPEKWNGILILAEAQNLSKTNNTYLQRLIRMNRKERFMRLSDIDNLGIQPWDDGTLKLAVSSVFPFESLHSFAVSNAVLWSQTDERGNNKTPDEELINNSISFWKDLLPVLKPHIIITCGKIASATISDIWNGRVYGLRAPSPLFLSRISGMFNKKDLLKRFPEVANAIEHNRNILNGGYEMNKIFFACHAVSSIR